MALYGSLATLRAQSASFGLFGPAFAYLDEMLRLDSPARARLQALAAGDTERVELTGGAFALEQVYPAKVRADGFFESHRKYLDVQVVIEGEEVMELADISRLAVRQDYNPERDLVVYRDCTEPSRLWVKAGEAAIFFPADGHMPGLRAGMESTLVRKTVVKVPVPA